VNRKELSAVIAECAARSERAEASIRESMARAEATLVGIEAARRKQEEAVARQEAVTMELKKRWAESDARWEKEQISMREAAERQEQNLQAYERRTDEMIAEGRAWMKKVTAELKDQQDERRALIEALFQLRDRLPPPPPHLRSA
jgi:hypothetical protein